MSKDEVIDREKQRLNQIAGLQVFQENALDSLLAHVQNSVMLKQRQA